MTKTTNNQSTINSFSENFEAQPTIDTLANMLQKILSNQKLDDEDELLSITEAAHFLKLAVPTLYAHVAQSTIPYFKPAKQLYFSKSELTDWVKNSRKKTKSELEIETDSYLENVAKEKKLTQK